MARTDKNEVRSYTRFVYSNLNDITSKHSLSAIKMYIKPTISALSSVTSYVQGLFPYSNRLANA